VARAALDEESPASKLVEDLKAKVGRAHSPGTRPTLPALFNSSCTPHAPYIFCTRAIVTQHFSRILKDSWHLAHSTAQHSIAEQCTAVPCTLMQCNAVLYLCSAVL